MISIDYWLSLLGGPSFYMQISKQTNHEANESRTMSPLTTALYNRRAGPHFLYETLIYTQISNRVSNAYGTV